MKAVDTALKTKLSAISGIGVAAPGGVHNTFRPQGSAFPVVVFQRVGSLDAPSFADGGVEHLDYQIRVIGDAATAAAVGGVVDSVHTALERGALAISGYTHMQTLRRTRIPRYGEQDASGMYVHDGATYRIWIAAA